MSVSSAQLLNSYRAILRHMRGLPSTKDRGSSLRRIIESKFQDASAADVRTLVVDYATLIKDISQAAKLRALDSGDILTQDEKIKAMASRVGLGLPKIYNENDQVGDSDDGNVVYTHTDEGKAKFELWNRQMNVNIDANLGNKKG